MPPMYLTASAVALSASISSMYTVNAESVAYSRLSGQYSDPNHPGCARQVGYEGNSVGSIVGSDAAGGEGAQCDGETDVAWGPLPASIDKSVIIADFSSKGGPSELQGRYSVEEYGILWEDGNMWPKLDQHPEPSVFNGFYSDPHHPDCPREVLYIGNSTGYVFGADSSVQDRDECDGVTDIAWGPLPAITNKGDIVVDFSTKGGPSDLEGTYNLQTYSIDWIDGNSWTKLKTK